MLCGGCRRGLGKMRRKGRGNRTFVDAVLRPYYAVPQKSGLHNVWGDPPKVDHTVKLFGRLRSPHSWRLPQMTTSGQHFGNTTHYMSDRPGQTTGQTRGDQAGQDQAGPINRSMNRWPTALEPTDPSLPSMVPASPGKTWKESKAR